MNVGGPAVEIAELMRSLDPQQFDQVLVTGLCADDEADYLETQAPDVPVTRLANLGRSIRPGGDALALRDLVRMIRTARPHVIHTHTAKAGVLGRVAARLARSDAKVVHTYHGHLLHGYFSPMKTKAVIGLERSLDRSTDAIVAVGSRVRDDLVDAGIGRPDQYRVIYSGVRIATLPDPDQARGDLGLPQDKVVVAMIGRLTRIKRPDRFVDIVRSVARTHPRAHFMVAGWGDQAEALAAAVESERLPVSILGWRDDLERLLAATDIMLLTSDNEGTPLSLVQAALAGIPAVASDVGSVSEVVEHGVTGLLAPPSASALAARVIELLDDPAARDRLGEAARRQALRRFDPAAFVAEHASLYESLVQPR